MKLSEIYKIANEIAPKSLSDVYCQTFGAYDNSGILVDVGEEITGILFSLDLTDAAIEEAIEQNANLIITHHPTIYGKIGKICDEGEGTLGGKLVQCIRNGISVISMHLNLDTAPDGIDESLMQGIALCAETNGVGTSFMKDIEYMHPFEGCAYGRSYTIPETELLELCENIGNEFSTPRILFYGEKKRKISRVASFCGSGADEAAVAFAKRSGADVIVSSDFKHHVLMMALESGLAVIALTHYASEQYGFRKYYKKIRQRIAFPCVYHTDDILF